MIPLVALIGRPNVGKSTLFNRLTKTSDALISDFPGLTRDRRYGYAKVNGYKFICIDTAGVTDIKTKENVMSITPHQSLMAIEEADAVLFIVDARASLVSEELEIAKYLRRHYRKATFLVANKSDGVDINQITADFWPLGFKKIYPIVASRGRGISNLLKIALFPLVRKIDLSKRESNKNNKVFLKKSIRRRESKETKSNFNFETQDFSIKIAVVGRPNTGKSTLINSLLGENRVVVYNEPGTTRDSVYIPMFRNKKEYVLIDTAGVRKRKRNIGLVEKLSIIKSIRAIGDANVVFLVLDAKEGILDQDFSLLWFILSSGSSLILVINKWDTLNQVSKEQIKETLSFRLSSVSFIRKHFISALYSTNIDELFNSVNEAYDCATKRTTSATLTNIMNMAINNHQPPRVRGRHCVKLKYAHPGGYNPPVVVIHGNRVKELPDSYKRYLENYFRKSLNIIGTSIHLQFKEGNNPYTKIIQCNNTKLNKK